MTAEPDSAQTQTLPEQADAGDAQACERLLGRHRAALQEFVGLRLDPQLRGRLDPSDLVQEAQPEALRRFPDYLRRRPMPFRLWLRQTASERLLMPRRRHVEAGRRAVGREARLPDRSSLALAGRLPAKESSPGRQAGRAELARRVRQALGRLGGGGPGHPADAQLGGAVVRGGRLHPGAGPRRVYLRPYPYAEAPGYVWLGRAVDCGPRPGGLGVWAGRLRRTQERGTSSSSTTVVSAVPPWRRTTCKTAQLLPSPAGPGAIRGPRPEAAGSLLVLRGDRQSRLPEPLSVRRDPPVPEEAVAATPP